MRIRTIKPEFWTSPDIAKMDWDTRLVFIGLWSYVDDNGVGRGEVPLIVAALFPLDDMTHGGLSESSVRVQAALNVLEQGGQISRYRVNGRPFLHVTAWDKHQKINRPSPGRYPLPVNNKSVTHGVLSESSVSPHNFLSAGTEEHRNIGTEEHRISSDAVTGVGRGSKKDLEAGSGQADPECARLCQELANRIIQNGNLKPNIGKRWLTECDRLIRIDKRPIDEIERVISWSQNNPFWKSNIMSMPTLRQKYDTLRSQMESSKQNPGTLAGLKAFRECEKENAA